MNAQANDIFDKTWREYYPDVVKAANLQLNNYFDAEDVASSVFLYLLERTKDNPDFCYEIAKYWLYVCAKHTAWRYKKQFYKFETVELDEEIDPYISTCDFERTQINKIFARDALRKLSDTKPEWCALLFYSVVLQKSYAEIAEAYGISKTKIKICIHRARKYLKSNCGITSEDALNIYIFLLFGTEFLELVSNYTKFN